MDVTAAGRRRELPPPQEPEMGKAVAAGRARVQNALPRATPAPAPKSATVEQLSRPSPEAKLQARLDQVMADMQGPYEVKGQTVRVTPHFRSLYKVGNEEKALPVQRIRAKVGREKFGEVALAAAQATGTRGTPADVRKTVQALIDAGALEDKAYRGLPPEQAIRRLMWDHEIGFDCRGYVGRAFLFSRGAGDKAMAPRQYGLKIELLTMPNPAFRAVPLAQARVGDWIRLDLDREGRDHNVIVRSSSTRSTQGESLIIHGKAVPKAFANQGWPEGSTASVKVLEVDSAWGGGNRGDFGGVERRVWVYNEKSGLWADWDERGNIRYGRGPYNHGSGRAYRPTGEP